MVTDKRFFDLFRKYDGFKKNEIKMKRPTQLMEVLELAREILHEQQVSIPCSLFAYCALVERRISNIVYVFGGFSYSLAVRMKR